MAFMSTIASGSSGNAAVISDGKTHILIDAGVSCRALCKGLSELDIYPGDIAAVLVTHEHGDHVRGLEIFCKKTGAPVYLSRGTAQSVLWKTPALHNSAEIMTPGIDFEIGTIGVSVFNTPHDTPESVGFTFYTEKKKFAYVTDLGCITPKIRQAVTGAEYMCIESNHDIMMLLGGSYPEYLKSRILSKRGHLSNEICADFIEDAIGWGAREITLCHLSRENNTPDIAYEEAMNAVLRAGAKDSDGVTVQVAPPDGVMCMSRVGA